MFSQCQVPKVLCPSPLHPSPGLEEPDLNHFCAFDDLPAVQNGWTVQRVVSAACYDIRALRIGQIPEPGNHSTMLAFSMFGMGHRKIQVIKTSHYIQVNAS